MWGVAYTIAKPATESFPPILLVAICYALAALVLFRPWPRMQTPFWALLAAGTLGGSVQSALIFIGVTLVPATTATLIVQTQVPFAVIAAWAMGQERMNRSRLLGITVALLGAAVVVGLPDAVDQTAGLLMIVLGTFSWGIAQGIIGTASHDSGARLMGALCAVAAPQALLMSVLLETGQREALANADYVDWATLLFVAICGFIVPYAIWYGLLRRYPVDRIAPFALLMPIVGVATAFVVLEERPSFLVFVGGAIILTGLAMVVRSPTIPIRSA